MVAYSAAKAGVHNLVQTLSEPGALGKPCTIIGLLPNVIDTEANRAAMPDAEHDTWTKPHIFADAIFHWTTDGTGTNRFPELENGHLYKFETLKSGRSIADYIDNVETAYQYKPTPRA